MDDQRLDEIEARAQAATDGPWVYGEEFDIVWQSAGVRGEICDCGTSGNADVDGPFIANARTDIPDMVAEIRRLKAEVAEIIAVAHKHGWNGVENSKILAAFLDDSLSMVEGTSL